ncbi:MULTISPECIES: biotin-independent malonate decarboxylase subunit gamma [unclassified Caballeronia]|uniref:biotin-independent malonate decarboxylase subunit gamma n=1 Tax=unclassified Caballeronia TaxID=2646786 RepID=UPI00285B87D6|nr:MULTISPECIES: biotin-independent malonate decarboxylase subunit gamma [unclassified Caballeronia]MDR5750086.1 biotin-independent malonate decarboxylase subunit gamma [Caballeronia sp. LZ024]MDR5842786.1 biotin-independent malonate decarboxylase subunit gamma [Caballeronia sp. LZ031]
MSTQELSKRGAVWLDALTYSAPLQAGYPPSVRVADARLGVHPARFIAVVPDPENPFPRARNGEVGLVEAWEVARAVREAVVADAGRDDELVGKRAIVAVIDVASQAYGRCEEAYGIHQALAGAADAYASARLAGHPVIGLIVGRAMSGALLAHGYQANRLIALADPQVMVHAMGKESAARVTLRSVAELEAFTARVPPMAYDIDNYASLGLLWKLLSVSNADAPTGADQSTVEKTLQAAFDDIRADPSRGLDSRLGSAHRAASATVRRKLREAWR